MAGLTQTEQQATLDARFPTSGGTDYIAFSANGSSETGSLARMAVGATGWAAATAATPSVKANGGTLTSPGASAGVTITHACVYSAVSGGTQRTDWQALAASKVLAIGETLIFTPGTAAITLD